MYEIILYLQQSALKYLKLNPFELWYPEYLFDAEVFGDISTQGVEVVREAVEVLRCRGIDLGYLCCAQCGTLSTTAYGAANVCHRHPAVTTRNGELGDGGYA